MSRSYHRVYPAIWDEPWDDDTRYVALYLLTCEHRRTEGLYRLRWPYVMADLGWPEERVRPAWDALVAHGFIEYDQAAGVVWIVKAVERQPPDNVNHAKAVVKALADLPDTPLTARFVKAARAASPGFEKAFSEAVVDGFRMPSDTHPDGYPERDGDSPPLPPPTTEQSSSAPAPERAESLHPLLDDVVAILEDPDLHVRLNVEPLAVDRALKAHPESDPIAAAQLVASWAAETEQPLRFTAANRLLSSALAKVEKRAADLRSIRAATDRRRQPSPQELDDAARLERMADRMTTTMNGGAA